MEPIWYINKTTGLVVLENGGIVDWNIFQMMVPKERLENYLSNCNQSNGSPNKKRRRSINEHMYSQVSKIST